MLVKSTIAHIYIQFCGTIAPSELQPFFDKVQYDSYDQEKDDAASIAAP